MAQPRGLASWRMLLLPSGRLLIFSHSGYKSTVQNHTTRIILIETPADYRRHGANLTLTLNQSKNNNRGIFSKKKKGSGRRLKGMVPARELQRGQHQGAWNNDFYQALNIIILPIIPEHHSPAGAILQAGFLAVISVFCIGNNLAVIKTMKTAKRKAWQGGVQKNPAAKEGP
uniref:Uncharacterized protein n=1 Tax=Oryza meridionalis TaxID=40149 RepID=A0A0E0DC64_9ORYZ